MSKRNLVAHYEGGSSDKVYLATIREDGGRFSVHGKWGRRGKVLQQQPKGTYDSEMGAEIAARELFQSKLKKGYIDIDSPRYNGSLTRDDASVKPYLEAEARGQKQPKTEKSEKAPAEPKTKAPEPKDGEVLVVECKSNHGMEEQFDVGLDYECETHKEKDMIWVYNKLGEKVAAFKERFGKPKIEV